MLSLIVYVYIVKNYRGTLCITIKVVLVGQVSTGNTESHMKLRQKCCHEIRKITEFLKITLLVLSFLISSSFLSFRKVPITGLPTPHSSGMPFIKTK